MVKIFVLAGPSGAGKSTLANMLNEVSINSDFFVGKYINVDMWIAMLYQDDFFIKHLIEYLFGNLYDDGKLNKDKLFDCYLKYPSKLVLLRQYIDQVLYHHILDIIRNFYDHCDEDDIILIECSNWFDFELCSNNPMIDANVIWVTANEAIRYGRLIERVGEEKAKKIFEIQYEHLTLPERDDCEMFVCTDTADIKDTFDCVFKLIKGS